MDNDRTPLAVIIAGANEHESRHVERLVHAAVVPLPPEAITSLSGYFFA